MTSILTVESSSFKSARSKGRKPHSWIEYWEQESIFSPVNWDKNMGIFLESSKKLLDLHAEDDVLDLGCGPGYLEKRISSQVRSVCGLDTSKRYIRMCQKEQIASKNTEFLQLGSDYMDFSLLGPRRFNKIICLSVVQYYKEPGEIQKLIEAVSAFAKPGARLLIADIPMRRAWHAPYIEAFLSAIRQGYGWEQFKFTLRARLSSYYHLYRKTGLLSLTEHELITLLNELEFSAEIIEDALTLDPSRRHLLVYFP